MISHSKNRYTRNFFAQCYEMNDDGAIRLTAFIRTDRKKRETHGKDRESLKMALGRKEPEHIQQAQRVYV